MKNLFLWAVALCSMFCLTGCWPELEEEDLSRATETVLSDEEWESFTFKSLVGRDDLQITRNSSGGQDSSDDNSISITTSKNSRHPFLVVATYGINCESCKTQAVWLNKLAGDFPSHGVDFIIIFLDMFDNSDTSAVTWLKKFSHVDPYTNVATACTKNACKQILAPHNIGPSAGAIYFVDKRDLDKVELGPDWRRAETPEEWYGQTKTRLAKFLNLAPVSFDAGVSGWTDQNSNDSNF